MLDIKSGLPPPKKRASVKWPHRDMCVGEFFEVRVDAVNLSTLYTVNWRWGKRLSRRFVTKVEDGIVRVWRVA